MSNQGALSKNSNPNMDEMEKKVDKLIKKFADVPDAKYRIIKELQEEYKDDEVKDAILNRYQDKLEKVKRVAEKIKVKLIAKYPHLNVKDYIKKLAPYKTKYNITDSEMNLVIGLLFRSSPVTQTIEFDRPYTEMTRALGFEPASLNLGSKMVVKPDEMEHLQGILQLNGLYKELHNQVSLQSLVYTDCSLRSINGRADRTRINMFSFIHPIIIALFIPKIDVIDNHFIQASISNIVAQKYNGNELTTLPDYELFTDISVDPSETACTGGKSKPFADLLARCQVQVKLWEAVLNLRQGKYYSNDLNSFILAIDNCKSNVFDAADFAYVKDEGSILRKLFGVFSFRPTFVNTSPIIGINDLATNCSSLAGINTAHLTSVSMLCMRISQSNINTRFVGNANQPIRLSNALQQQQFFAYKGRIETKQQEVLYSNGVLVFYVHRRYHHIDTTRQQNPYIVATLPMTMSSYERINQHPVDFSQMINIQQQAFNLKSVICLETTNIGNVGNVGTQDLIIGCNAFVRCNCHAPNIDGIKYAPLSRRTLSGTSPNEIEPLSFYDYPILNAEARSKGTLFIYTEQR
jgi:hypothetical protein